MLGFSLLLCSCASTTSRAASIERTTGVQAGQPVDLVTVRQEQAQAQTQVDVAPAVQAAVSAALGDLPGVLRQVAARPAAPSQDDIERTVAELLAQAPKPPTVAEIATAVPVLKSDDVKEIIEQSKGTDWSGFIGGGGIGALLLAIREALAKREAKRDGDEAWDELKKRGAVRTES